MNANDTANMLSTLRSLMETMVGYLANGGNGGEFVFNINGKEFYRASLQDLRAVERANPEVATA